VSDIVVFIHVEQIQSGTRTIENYEST